jgi:hypothetical protein
MADSFKISISVTAARAIMGVPRAPKATGAVFAINDSPQAARGLKPSCIRMAAVMATGVPKPAAPSKNAPNAKAIRITCILGSGAMVDRCILIRGEQTLIDS